MWFLLTKLRIGETQYRYEAISLTFSFTPAQKAPHFVFPNDVSTRTMGGHTHIITFHTMQRTQLLVISDYRKILHQK